MFSAPLFSRCLASSARGSIVNPATTATLLSGTKGWGNGGEIPQKARNSQSASSLTNLKLQMRRETMLKNFFVNRFEKVGQIPCPKQTEGGGGRIRRGGREEEADKEMTITVHTLQQQEKSSGKLSYPQKWGKRK